MYIMSKGCKIQVVPNWVMKTNRLNLLELLVESN